MTHLGGKDMISHGFRWVFLLLPLLFHPWTASAFEPRSSPPAALAREPVARVESVTGAVTAEEGGRSRPVKPGDGLFPKETLRSGENGTAEISFPDGSRIRLVANTVLGIADYVYSPAEKVRRGVVSLIAGKVGLRLAELPEYSDDRFRVLASAAVAIGRGTEFVVARDHEAAKDAVCAGGRSSALVLRNSVVVLGTEALEHPVVLMPGMTSQVCGPNRPTPPRFATRAERARLLSGLEGFFAVSRESPASGPVDAGPEGARPGASVP